MPGPVRAFMEPRFGMDFSQVRVHTGSEAQQMNQAVSAQAFTHGKDIYFGAGRSPAHLELTAHELTHVVQQMGGVPLRTNRLEKVTIAESDPSIQESFAATGIGRIEEKESDPSSVHELQAHKLANVMQQNNGIQSKLDIAKPAQRELMMQALAVLSTTTLQNSLPSDAAGKAEMKHEVPFSEDEYELTNNKAKVKETPVEAADSPCCISDGSSIHCRAS